MASQFFSFVLALSLSKGCLFVFAFAACAQETINLVPNPSFEEFENGCPVHGQDLPVGWSSWRNTPDCFSTCPEPQNFQDSLFWVPWNGMGYRWPADGEAYCGLYAHGQPWHPVNKNYREYLGCELLEPLEVGTAYYVHFKVSMGYFGNYYWLWWASNRIGAIFTNGSFNDDQNPMEIPNFAHIYTEDVITDTTDWVIIEGSFIADSAYSHMALGVFFEYELLETLEIVPLNPPSKNSLGSYYFVDDVCVSQYPDCVYVNVADNEGNIEPFVVYPNPSQSSFRIQSDQSIIRVRLHSMNGQSILLSNLAGSNSEWDVSRYPSGVHVVEVQTNENKILREKLVIVH